MAVCWKIVEDLYLEILRSENKISAIIVLLKLTHFIGPISFLLFIVFNDSYFDSVTGSQMS